MTNVALAWRNLTNDRRDPMYGRDRVIDMYVFALMTILDGASIIIV